MKEVTYASTFQTPKEYLEGCQIWGNIGKAEAEDVLSRILLGFCLKENRWVAPSWHELDEQVESDRRLIEEICVRNHEKRLEYEAKKAKQSLLRRLVGKEIPEPEYEDVPFTVVILSRDAHIDGLHYALEYGFVEAIQDGSEYFFKVTEKGLLAIK